MKINLIYPSLILSSLFLNAYAMDSELSEPRINAEQKKDENKSAYCLIALAQDLRHSEEEDIEKSRLLFQRAIENSKNSFDRAKRIKD